MDLLLVDLSKGGDLLLGRLYESLTMYPARSPDPIVMGAIAERNTIPQRRGEVLLKERKGSTLKIYLSVSRQYGTSASQRPRPTNLI